MAVNQDNNGNNLVVKGIDCDDNPITDTIVVGDISSRTINYGDNSRGCNNGEEGQLGTSIVGLKLTWEYLVVLLDFARSGNFDEMHAEKLNALGAEGWELISVTTENMICPSVAYLKRVLWDTGK